MGVSVIYKDIPPEIKENLIEYSILNNSDRLSTISLERLKEYDESRIKYATFEKDYWRLDGTFMGVVGQSQLIWGKDVSIGGLGGISIRDKILVLANDDKKSRFDNPPSLTRTWEGHYNSPGLYFVFLDDYCNDLDIVWYDDDIEVAREHFEPDSPNYFCRRRVDSFNKITITFNTMSKPNRFLKIVDIMDGNVVEFLNDNIRELNIVEEVSLISDTMPINEMNLHLSHKTDDMNLVFQTKQVLDIYLNDTIYGKFFVNKSESTYEVSAHDYKGLLDLSTFMGGFYNKVPASAIIASIFEGENIPYTVDDATSATLITGYIPKCSKREALVQVLFRTQSLIDDSRSETLNIFKLIDIEKEIPKNKTFINGADDLLNSPVTQVELTAHNYTPEDEIKSMFKSELTEGTYTIEFSSPINIEQATITGASFTTIHPNYCIIQVAEEGEVEIKAQQYVDNKIVMSRKISGIISSVPTNVKSYSNFTLVSLDGVEEILTALCKYHTMHNDYEAKAVFTTEKPSDKVKMYTWKGDERVGYVKKVDYKLRNKAIGTITEVVE